ncbi:glucose inhibited division protein B [Aurantiacibacter atlanticus]|uniref:Ribosomal RNA small subunit methyltransferase G n=1 Tax=Aurantiacibacter atlanticus TaxID=1648404 RepID=A0A0H4VE25_9SPHN|nr:16S rRNA (guanine(527)-N(7))-methyltransferase RsmG [Aurantiacibacter atlanticus]AKQ41106.1 glucose inhibited division protein B [Aurantiacibacter atlanticus]MDF1833466.1 16S rRNA (guanine(527)-N(7))-methyltransferase RsmG [Alteraurantiacibacter sp. bin_em_oilr2.035]
MMDNEEQARAFCDERADASAMLRLDRFIAMLAQENNQQNLVSNSSLNFVWQRHIADSLQLLDHVPRGTSPWLDLGSGAGIPGLILAIARPDMQFVLVESRRKRVEWLQQVKTEFGLSHCSIHGSRLELVESHEMAVITARAFAPMPKLLNLSARFSTRSTYWVLPKGRSGAQELKEQPEAIQKMFHVEQSATDGEAGILIGTGRPPLG